MKHTSHYSSIPTYIPPVNFKSDFPAYVPTTSVVSRSSSGRVVYDDDPWNSAKIQSLSAAATTSRDASSLSRQPKGHRQRPSSWMNPARQPQLSQPTAGPSRQASPPTAGPSKLREQPETIDSRRGSRSSEHSLLTSTISTTRQRPRSMPPPAPPVRNATPQPSASPFNIPYSLIGSLHINAPTSSLNSLPRSRPVSRSGSPPSIHLSSRSGSPPSIRSARHPTLLTPGSNVSSLQSRTPSPGAGRQLQQLSFAGPAVSPALPAPPTPLTHSVLSPLMPSGVWMSPTGATNPMTACSSRSSSMDLFWDDITRYGNSRAPMGRKVSDNIEEGALSPVHSLSITEVGYVAFTQTVDVPSSEPEGAEESLESPADDPGLWRGWEEEEAGIDGSDTETTVAALRRQLQDDEQDENEWNTITDMLLARLTSRAATMTSD